MARYFLLILSPSLRMVLRVWGGSRRDGSQRESNVLFISCALKNTSSNHLLFSGGETRKQEAEMYLSGSLLLS